ncbi:MAG: T9SS type A sorting domain-containing protein [Bacteroidota bacterium]
MKTIRHFFSLFSLILIMWQPLQAQTLTFNVDTVTAEIDSMVTVFIRVDSFTNIAGYQGTIRFDTAAVDFMGLSSPQPGINNIFGNPGQGLIPLDAATFSWIDFSGGTVTLADSTAVIEISFQVKSTAVAGTYPVEVNGSVTDLLYTQGAGVIPPLANPGAVVVETCTPTADARFSFLSSACINGFNPQALIFGDLGGSFAVDNGASINPVTGILDLSTTIAGTSYNVTYSVGSPCVAVDTQTIQILAADDASFSIPDTVCISEASLLPMLTGTTGGTFTVDNGATIDASTGSLDLGNTMSNTTYTITYQTPGNCPAASSQSVFISDTLDASFAYPELLCPGAANPVASDILTTGGSFSISPMAAIDPSTGEVDLSTITQGVSYTISYTLDDFCESSSQIQFLLEDNTPPVVICRDITVMLDSTGIAVIDPTMIDSASSDNCEIMDITLSQDTFRVGGVQTVDLIVVDMSGNSDTCTAMVTVDWPTSVRDLYSSEMNLRAYPNPVKDRLQLELESPWTGELHIQFLNSMGQVVKQASMMKQGRSWKADFELSALSRGMYMISLEQNGYYTVERFLKN